MQWNNKIFDLVHLINHFCILYISACVFSWNLPACHSSYRPTATSIISLFPWILSASVSFTRTLCFNVMDRVDETQCSCDSSNTLPPIDLVPILPQLVPFMDSGSHKSMVQVDRVTESEHSQREGAWRLHSGFQNPLPDFVTTDSPKLYIKIRKIIILAWSKTATNTTVNCSIVNYFIILVLCASAGVFDFISVLNRESGCLVSVLKVEP